MATKDTVKNAINESMIALKKYSPTSFDRLNSMPEEKAKILTAAKAIADEEVKLAHVFKELPKEEDVRELMAKHLPPYRIALIEQGFLPQTYQIHITRKVDDFFYVDFIRDGKPIFSLKKSDMKLAISIVRNFQIASIVVEAVLLVMQAVGMSISVSEIDIARIAEEILPVIESSSQLQKVVEDLQEAAKGDSKKEIAKAIFNLIKDSNSAGILWQIIKSLCINMSQWDWIKTAAVVTSMIVAATATHGVALIAKIILVLNSAHGFIKKLQNPHELKHAHMSKL